MATTDSYRSRSAFIDILSQPAIHFDKPPFVDRAAAEKILLLDDLQANILKHHRKEFSYHLFITFKKDKGDSARKWISGFAEKVTTARRQLQNRKNKEIELKVIRCLYLTPEGYNYLGASHLMPRRSPSFTKGLRDTITSTFHHGILDKSIASEAVHMMILLASDHPDDLINELAEIEKELPDQVNKHFGIMKFDSEAKEIVTEWSASMMTPVVCGTSLMQHLIKKR